MNTQIEAIVRRGDEPWGDTLAMWFAIAEVLWALGEEIPAGWQFRPSPMHEKGRGLEAVKEGGDWPDAEVVYLYETDQVTVPELVHAGNVFTRYAEILKLAGKDY